MASTTRNRIVIADDHPIVRQGLKRILNDGDMEVVTEAGSYTDLWKVLSNDSLPDALVLDLSMPGGSPLDSLKELREKYPALPVLVLSIHPEDQYALRTLRAGAAGYLTKESAPEQLVAALKEVISGKRFLTPAVRELEEKLKEGEGSRGEKQLHSILSDRELDVLLLIAQGTSLTQIANLYSLSVKTISTYRHRILKKMKFQSNADIVRYCMNTGLGGVKQGNDAPSRPSA